MSTPDRVLGDDPLDAVRVTLSRQLRRVCYEAGLVPSPELPLYATRPEHPARALPPTLGTDGPSCLSSRVQDAPDGDTAVVAPPYPVADRRVSPTSLGERAQALQRRGPRPDTAARAVPSTPTLAPTGQGVR